MLSRAGEPRRNSMRRTVHLRSLTSGEGRLLRAKLRDLSLSARIHQRYRLIAELRAGRPVLAAAERSGCHFTAAYGWVHRFSVQRVGLFDLRARPESEGPAA